jgi:hypothetical protein
MSFVQGGYKWLIPQQCVAAEQSAGAQNFGTKVCRISEPQVVYRQFRDDEARIAAYIGVHQAC